MQPFPKYTSNIYVGKQTVQKQEEEEEEYLCINIKTFHISIYPLYMLCFWSVVKSTKRQKTNSHPTHCFKYTFMSHVATGDALVAELR